MAWVSYLEDIVERLDADLGALKKKIEEPSEESGLENKTVAKSLISQCHNLLSEVETHLDIVTDPDLDLAHANTELTKALETEKWTVRELESKIKELQLTILDRNRTIKETSQEYRDLEEKYKKLSRDFERSFKDNPEGAYEHFSSAERAEKYKRG